MDLVVLVFHLCCDPMIQVAKGNLASTPCSNEAENDLFTGRILSLPVGDLEGNWKGQLRWNLDPSLSEARASY